MSDTNTTQVGGSHYKGTTYQHWDFVLRALEGRYLEGNITKYVARHRKKNGLEDLRKARHYLTKLIEEFNVGNVKPMLSENGWFSTHHAPSHFCDVNGIDISERMIILAVSGWGDRKDLHRAGALLDALIDREQYADEEQRAKPVDDGKVLLPYEATDAMKESVKTILSSRHAGMVWQRMADAALFNGEACSGYVNQG